LGLRCHLHPDNGVIEIRKRVGKLDVREDERLCAIAFVKRMLPRLAEQDQRLIGWKVNTRSWPSTAYVAAGPWIKEAWGKGSLREAPAIA
jgi:hypothetical protein